MDAATLPVRDHWWPAEARALVERVIDGDTVVALLLVTDATAPYLVRARVRLAGIDTPEMRGGTADTKAAADQCRSLLEQLVAGKWVALTVACADHFGRLVCRVTLPHPDGAIDVAQHMLAHGPGTVSFDAKSLSFV